MIQNKIIFSAIQPSGKLHLGNYLGAIRPWVKLANSIDKDHDKMFIGLADLHALTSHPSNISKSQSLITAIHLLSCGIDPISFPIVLFRQSRVLEHTLLAWVLSCLSPLGRLQRMVQFKERKRNLSNDLSTISAGILSYPILQAADILLYRSTHVPVGEDQTQHLELCRFLAERLKQTRSIKDLSIPQPLITSQIIGGRIMSLKDPLKKMSKSDPCDSSRINIDDSPDVIRSKIRGAVTECYPKFDIPVEEMAPAMANLVTIYKSLSDSTDIPAFSSVLEFKSEVSQLIINTFSPIQQKIEELKNSPFVEDILSEGESMARKRAQETLILLNI